MCHNHRNLITLTFDTETLENALGEACDGNLSIWHRLKIRNLAISLWYDVEIKKQGSTNQNHVEPLKALTNFKANLQRRKKTSDILTSSRLIEIPEPANTILHADIAFIFRDEIDGFTQIDFGNDKHVELLMDAVKQGDIDLVIAEALDRISRDQEDVAAIYKRLQFAGVTLLTLSEGEISELHIGLKGTMNALFLKDLAEKTKRGQRGRIELGRVPGGKSYGYNLVHNLLDNGQVDRGQRTVNEEEASVVKRIFNEYVNGNSPRKIASELNKDNIPAPGVVIGTPLPLTATRNDVMASLIMSYILDELSITDKVS